jgi:hypothetical protein
MILVGNSCTASGEKGLIIALMLMLPDLFPSKFPYLLLVFDSGFQRLKCGLYPANIYLRPLAVYIIYPPAPSGVMLKGVLF